MTSSLGWHLGPQSPMIHQTASQNVHESCYHATHRPVIAGFSPCSEIPAIFPPAVPSQKGLPHPTPARSVPTIYLSLFWALLWPGFSHLVLLFQDNCLSPSNGLWPFTGRKAQPSACALSKCSLGWTNKTPHPSFNTAGSRSHTGGSLACNFTVI